MSIARQFGEFVAGYQYADLPAEASDYAAMLVSSTLASAAMGRQLKSTQIVTKLLMDRGGTEEATVWYHGGKRLPLASAARINAMSSDAAASDDSDLRNITHPGTTVVSAALAVAEKTGATGRDVLTAIALGYEVAGRINGGVIPGLMWEKGFHGCVIAIFGGAVTASRLLKLDADGIANAIGLAATSLAGLIAAASNSVAREHHAGLAAMLGMEAAQLAAGGYAVEQQILEKPRGFFATYGVDAHESGRVAAVTQNLGGEWQILTNMAIKLVPGAHPLHTTAEAAAKAATTCDAKPEEILSIVIQRPDKRQLYGARHPVDLVGMAHSPYYFAAAGAADRSFSWIHASQDKIMDPTIRRLLDVVEIKDGPTERVDDYRLQGVTVTVTTRDGRSATESVFAPRGAAINGIAWDDVDAKFRKLAPLAGLDATRVEGCIGMLHALSELENVDGLVKLLR